MTHICVTIIIPSLVSYFRILVPPLYLLLCSSGLSRFDRSSSSINVPHMRETMEVARKCCCFLVNKQDGTKGPGILFKFDRSGDQVFLQPQELQRLLPGIRKAGKLETTCAILVCHRIVPGICAGEPPGVENHLAGGILYYKGREYKLDEIVSGSVSCCGMDSVIGPGDTMLREPHLVTNPTRNNCTIGLDFTLLFLLKKFIYHLTIELGLELVTIPCTSFSHQNVPSLLTIFFTNETGVSLQQHAIELCATASYEQPLFPGTPKQSLREQINNFKAVQRLHYKANSDSILPPGGAIILSKEDGKSELIGYHVEKTHDDRCYVGNTLYGIVHLLQGR